MVLEKKFFFEKKTLCKATQPYIPVLHLTKKSFNPFNGAGKLDLR